MNKVEEIYQLFRKIYFKYTSGHGYFFQLDLFNQMCTRWIENNTSIRPSSPLPIDKNNNNNKISLSQKIVEILALNPKLTLQELATRTKTSEKDVKKVMREYSSFPNYQPYDFLVGDESGKHTKYLKSLTNLESGLYEIEVLQKAFADEISFVYYLNLNQDIYFPVLFPQDDYFAAANLPYDKGKSKEFLSREYDKYSLTPQKSRILPTTPKERLLEIFRQDKGIREWFSSWIVDSLEYQKQVTESMSLFYDKIR